ncbi:nitroreductase/quinone reductase family protein [Emcibacter sp. SYSU 3D8]|uniref:nitroreductase/quinone reductase family protein n=1 Tax=Emcibacter sp. SYSU 3D8 TaxID=3133969 RepID=UPI0031FEF07C
MPVAAMEKRLIKFLLGKRGMALDLWLVRVFGRSLLNVLMGRRQGFTPQPMLVLSTRGARSGLWRRAALPYFQIGESIIVVGSKGGAPDDPAWVTNLRVHPEAALAIRGRRRQVVAHVAAGDERTALWAHVTRAMEVYTRYQKRTDREIPVVVFEAQTAGR